jgi:hypothetical protein
MDDRPYARSSYQISPFFQQDLDSQTDGHGISHIFVIHKQARIGKFFGCVLPLKIVIFATQELALSLMEIDAAPGKSRSSVSVTSEQWTRTFFVDEF